MTVLWEILCLSLDSCFGFWSISLLETLPKSVVWLTDLSVILRKQWADTVVSDGVVKWCRDIGGVLYRRIRLLPVLFVLSPPIKYAAILNVRFVKVFRNVSQIMFPRVASNHA